MRLKERIADVTERLERLERPERPFLRRLLAALGVGK